MSLKILPLEYQIDQQPQDIVSTGSIQKFPGERVKTLFESNVATSPLMDSHHGGDYRGLGDTASGPESVQQPREQRPKREVFLFACMPARIFKRPFACTLAKEIQLGRHVPLKGINFAAGLWIGRKRRRSPRTNLFKILDTCDPYRSLGESSEQGHSATPLRR